MIEISMLTGLILNGALLLGLVIAADLIPRHLMVGQRLVHQLVQGGVVALFGVSVMLAPVVLTPGLLFDVRSVLLSLAGLFLGALPTFIAMGATAALRAWQGGVGVGLGVGVIVASGLIGLAWRRWAGTRLARIGPAELYGFGVVIHLAMVAILSALPAPYAGQFWREAAGPVMLVYPLLTLFVGRLITARRAHSLDIERLQASETRFRTLFENSHAVMLVVDPTKGAIVDANRAAVDYYGWPPETLLTMRIQQINTLSPAEIQVAMARAAQRGGSSFEFKHRRAHGDVREVEVFSGPVERDGRLLLYSLVIDVHDRRRADSELRERVERQAREHAARAEAQRQARLAALNLAEDALRNQRSLMTALGRLELLIEHAPAALAMLDRQLRFTAVSRRWITDYGLENVEIIGRHHDEIFPDILGQRRDVYRQALSGEVLRRDEDILLRPDRTLMWQRWEVRPWYGENEVIGGIVVFTEDITSAVQAKEQLVKLSRAVEQSQENIVITDAVACIEYANEAFETTSGYSREEVLGENPRFLQSGKTPKATYEAMWATLTKGQAWKGEFINRRKDGTEYVELASLSPITGPDGTVTHYLAVKEDVTEKKQVAEELERHRHDLESLVAERTIELEEARRRAEVANEAKSTFLANMSHEIRTPLNAIGGLTHLLLRDDPRPSQRDRLRKVDDAARHLSSIVSDILDLAKIEAGKVAIEERDFHLSAVLDQVRSMVAETARAKGLALEIDRDAVPLWLRGDPVRLRQALLNLASNAVKFTTEGFVRLRSDLLEEDASGLLVQFAVEDTGIGIAPERLPYVFDAFETGDPSITRDYGGTGLGLVITRRLAELMGGSVGIESVPDEGTRVWFTVRLRRGHGVMPADPVDGYSEAVSWRLFAGARILLAEDHAVSREVAEEMLFGFGLDVDAATNGNEAIALASRNIYDLVLMDLQMPELDGLSATRVIRTLGPYATVPILAMTANVFAEDRQACLAAGMNGFVPKPVDPDALRTTIASWLQRGGSRAPEPPVEFPETRPAMDLDVAAAVRRLGGDADPHHDFLRRFIQDHADDERQIRALLDAGQQDAARGRVHALKGGAATLGATRLSAAAAALEATLRGEAPVDAELVEEVIDAMKDLRVLVERLPPPAEGTAAAPGNPMGPEELIDRLGPLLEADDPDALDLLLHNRAALLAACGEGGAALARAIERFDFAGARALFARICTGGG